MAEEYIDIDVDFYFEHYYFDKEDGLEYREDCAAAMTDRLGVGVRYYYYDAQEDDILYYFGVDDIGDIIYTQDRAVYPMTYYSDEEEKYTKVYAKSEAYEIVLLFGAALESIKIFTLEGGKVLKYEYYDASGGNADDLKHISESSSIDEVVTALRDSGIEAVFSEDYLYYKDTMVTESVFITSRDPGIGTAVTKQVDFTVEEKDGYYIVSSAAREYARGEKVAAQSEKGKGV